MQTIFSVRGFEASEEISELCWMMATRRGWRINMVAGIVGDRGFRAKRLLGGGRREI